MNLIQTIKPSILVTLDHSSDPCVEVHVKQPTVLDEIFICTITSDINQFVHIPISAYPDMPKFVTLSHIQIHPGSGYMRGYARR